MEKNTLVQKPKKHRINIHSKKYQLIFEDCDIKIEARFYLVSGMVVKGDFKLTNLRTKPSKKYKLHRVEFCEKPRQLVSFLSNHSSFKSKKHKIKDEDISSFSLKNLEEVPFKIRVNDDDTRNSHKPCDHPIIVDKEGSILIGTEAI